MEKYYTPEMEDIRIGYEMYAPILDENRQKTGELQKVIISSPNWANEISDVHIPNMEEPNKKTYKLGDIWRVPYLTKEQILTEGWIYKKSYVSDFDSNRDVFTKSIHTLTLDYDTINRNIFIEEGNIYPSVLFRGKCKSINELRYVIKLLEL